MITKDKAKNPPPLPKLCGARLLGRICLHPTLSSKPLKTDEEILHDLDDITRISAQPPSADRLKEEAQGKRKPLSDRFSRFLCSHIGDRPWRREEGELPMWDPSASLSNKAAILTAKIASNFCDWYRGLGGSAIIDEAQIQALFDIKFPDPARTAISVDVRELQPSEIPPQVVKAAAISSGFPPLPPIRPPPKNPVRVAFGRCVPETVHSERPPCNALPLPQPPRGLLSMERVFTGITQLQSTQGYCQLLHEKPEIPRPKYLVDANLITDPYSLKMVATVTSSPGKRVLRKAPSRRLKLDPSIKRKK